jgi:enoyl-CoA hydratase/carnithine racemase
MNHTIAKADTSLYEYRFIATVESDAPDAHKALLVGRASSDPTFTGKVAGVPANWMKESIHQNGLAPDNLPEPMGGGLRHGHLPEGVHPWKTLWSAGQRINLIEEAPPVVDLVRRLRAEYLAARDVADISAAARLANALSSGPPRQEFSVTELVSFEREAGVATITFLRPAQLNAMNNEMGEAFELAMVAAEQDNNVRVVVITGSGRGFCAGADMERLQTLADDGGTALTQQPAGGIPAILDALGAAPEALRDRYVSPFALSKPVIAAINGVVAGVGLSLAVSCDIRFASREAVFVAGFPRRGLTAEAGLAWSLSALVGRGAASDILLSGRRVTAHEAQGMGLVNAVTRHDTLMSHTLAYAQDMAANASPRSTRVIKRQIQLALQQTFVQTLELSRHELVESLKAEDFREGVASFRERRAPNFTGR